MIDWRLVTASFVWILGAALVVWTWSYNRSRIVESSDPRPIWIGVVLFCVGQAFAGGRWWEIAGWIALAIWSAVHLRDVLRMVNDHA